MANITPPSATGTAVISSQYCAPATHSIDLIITKERTLADNFTVTDKNGNLVFTVKSSLVTIVTPRRHRFLYDAYGNPILHLRRAVTLLPANDSWEAFRGESKEAKDIFTRKRSSLMQIRTKLHVFLANNNTGVCDYTVKASLSGWYWDVFIGESDIVAAQISMKFGSIVSRKKFMVTVGPNIDYAFIVSLIVTLD